MALTQEEWHLAFNALLALGYIGLCWRNAKLERRLHTLADEVANRAVLLPAGPPGPVGPVGLRGPPGPPAACKCAEAEQAVQDARTPQEKRAATMQLHRLIREGKMSAPKGWKAPRKRKKKARRKKKAG